MQNQAPWDTFQAALATPDPVLDFVVQHPHFIEHLMKQFGVVISAVLQPFMLVLRAMWQAPPLVSVNPKPLFDLPSIEVLVESMQLDSDAFLAILTDHQQYEIQQMHEQNHNAAVQHGYAHVDQQTGQALTAWGVSGGGQSFQAHQSDPYHSGQPQYPNQPVGFAQSPWQPQQGYQGQQQQPTMRGALLGAGLNFLMNPQQQQQQQQQQQRQQGY
jgi:hypothetical protein